MAFDIGDDYVILCRTRTLVCEIVNKYEEAPGVWAIVVREPESKTLLIRRMRPPKAVPLWATGGNN